MKKTDQEETIIITIITNIIIINTITIDIIIDNNSCNSVYIIFQISNFFLNVVDEKIYLDGDHSRTISASASYYEYGTKTWSITAPEHTHIEMTFEKIDLDSCNYGSLEVRDGLQSYSKLIGRYCHATSAPVKSTGEYLWVKFNSKYGKGSFKATCRGKPGIHKLNNNPSSP